MPDVRRRLRAIPNITVLDDHDVADICVTAQRRVTGVRVVRRSTNVAAELTADLIVDATGRGSRTPAALKRLGYESPAEDDVVVDVMYASQLVADAPGRDR